jgi:hypothetical protein
MHRYLPVVRSMKSPKFLTLTVPRRSLARDDVTRLRNDFTRLRHRGLWKATGGVYQLEVGTLDDRGKCNMHIHAVIDSPWMSQKELSDAWRDITGGYIVDIRQAKGDRALLRYMTKHLVKFASDVPLWAHDLVNDVLHDTRLVQGFGTLSRLGLSVHDRACPCCGAVNSVICLDFEPCYQGFFGGIVSD